MGLDHVSIQIVLPHPCSISLPPSPNWAMTDWPNLDPLLKELDILPSPQLPTGLALKACFDRHHAGLTCLLTSHTPTRSPSYRSKPW